jgi:hypothetical protein
MKCVIVALALLCSAQALKMDRAPGSARARKHIEMFDEIDRKAGRPERSKIGRAQFKKNLAQEFGGKIEHLMKAPTVKSKEEITDDVCSGIFEWADNYGLTTSIATCALTMSDAQDLMNCVGSDLATGSAGLNDAFCAQIDAWNTDAEDIINHVMKGTIEGDSSYDGIAKEVKAFMAETSKDGSKKAGWQEVAETYSAADQYLAAYGIIVFVSNIIGGYSFYCDEVVADTMQELLDKNDIGDGETYTTNIKAQILAATEDGVNGAAISGTKTFGKLMKDSYDASQKDPVVDLLLIDINSRRQMGINYNKWRKGTFRRMARRPQ